ncbi:MAG TPA: hypothetical protein VFT30_08035, partial [Nitrospira sp.]|nr:hypothetical protein [Nitrospira sp.]
QPSVWRCEWAGARLGDGMIASGCWEWNEPSDPYSGKLAEVRSVVLASETGLDEELVASLVVPSICLGCMLPRLPRLTAMLLE